MDTDAEVGFSEQPLSQNVVSGDDSWLDLQLLIYEDSQTSSPMEEDVASDEEEAATPYDEYRFTHVVVVNPDPGPIAARLSELQTRLTEGSEWLYKLILNTEVRSYLETIGPFSTRS